MRKLRKAAVVAVMVGSMGMFGAGVAAAGGHGKDGGKGWGGGGDFTVNNPQFHQCPYISNVLLTPAQTVAMPVMGGVTQNVNAGNFCPQSGSTINF